MIWRVSAKYEEKKSAHMKSIWVFHLKFLRWVKNGNRMSFRFLPLFGQNLMLHMLISIFSIRRKWEKIQNSESKLCKFFGAFLEYLFT